MRKFLRKSVKTLDLFFEWYYNDCAKAKQQIKNKGEKNGNHRNHVHCIKKDQISL